MTKSRLPSFYVVTDRHQAGEDRFRQILRDLTSERELMLQIREKDLGTRGLLRLVREIQHVASPFRVPCFVNDRVDLVLATQTAGVHLRSDSMPVKEARKCLGRNFFIGKSVHSQEEAIQSEKDGADFVVFGPTYETPSKRAYGPPLGVGALRDVCRRCHVPVYAVGGVTLARVDEVMEAGAYGVAVISSVFRSPVPREAVKNYVMKLRANRP